jgi:competence protein ComFC
MRLLNTILDMIFPRHCVSCGNHGSDLCLKCLIDSPEALRESANWIFPLYDYRHPAIKKSLHLLKYKGRKNLANVFAEAMYGRILEELSELSLMENFKDVILVPIPLSPKRKRERGFNQAELLVRELCKIDNGQNFTFENNILIKPRETIHQAHIENRNERLKNIIGSFSIKNGKQSEEKIKNRNIILIDDVTTTGATLSEAKKVLKNAGVRKVIALTIAH